MMRSTVDPGFPYYAVAGHSHQRSRRPVEDDAERGATNQLAVPGHGAALPRGVAMDRHQRRDAGDLLLRAHVTGRDHLDDRPGIRGGHDPADELPRRSRRDLARHQPAQQRRARRRSRSAPPRPNRPVSAAPRTPASTSVLTTPAGTQIADAHRVDHPGRRRRHRRDERPVPVHRASSARRRDGQRAAGLAEQHQSMDQGRPHAARRYHGRSRVLRADAHAGQWSGGAVPQCRRCCHESAGAAQRAATPLYLSITRTGTTFSASTSPDGVTWTLVAGSTVPLSGLTGSLLAGMVVIIARHQRARHCHLQRRQYLRRQRFASTGGTRAQPRASQASPVRCRSSSVRSGIRDSRSWPHSIPQRRRSRRCRVTPPPVVGIASPTAASRTPRRSTVCRSTCSSAATVPAEREHAAVRLDVAEVDCRQREDRLPVDAGAGLVEVSEPAGIHWDSRAELLPRTGGARVEMVRSRVV